MRHVMLPPHVLLIEPTSVYALLSSAELDAAGFEVTLAGSLEDGRRCAETILDPERSTPSTIILINISAAATPQAPFPGLRLARQLRQQIDRGLLREAVIVGLVERTTAAVEAAAQEAGCHLLQTPLRASAAEFMRRLVVAAAFVAAPEATGARLHPAHAA